MAKIIIERDEEGLLVGHIEGDLHESVPAWVISEHLKNEIGKELADCWAGEFADEFDPVFNKAISMLKGEA